MSRMLSVIDRVLDKRLLDEKKQMSLKVKRESPVNFKDSVSLIAADRVLLQYPVNLTKDQEDRFTQTGSFICSDNGQGD